MSGAYRLKAIPFPLQLINILRKAQKMFSIENVQICSSTFDKLLLMEKVFCSEKMGPFCERKAGLGVFVYLPKQWVTLKSISLAFYQPKSTKITKIRCVGSGQCVQMMKLKVAQSSLKVTQKQPQQIYLKSHVFKEPQKSHLD